MVGMLYFHEYRGQKLLGPGILRGGEKRSITGLEIVSGLHVVFQKKVTPKSVEHRKHVRHTVMFFKDWCFFKSKKNYERSRGRKMKPRVIFNPLQITRLCNFFSGFVEE